MVASRWLHNWGARVILQLATDPDQLAPVPKHQLQGLLAAGVPVKAAGDQISSTPDLIIDALLGYSVKGAPRPPMDALVERANLSPAPILALDLPSGLNPDSGQPQEPTIRAVITMTLALPKVGLTKPAARDHVGQLWLADISLPAALYHEIGLKVSRDLFAQKDLLRLHP
jgi:NAD(P)H-hydrate epimerase